MFAAVRVRGNVHLNPDIKKTLESLCLTRTNHLVLVPEKQLPMLKKAEAYVTYGEIEEKILVKVLKKRARLSGDKRIDEKWFKEKKIGSVEELAKNIISGKIVPKQLGIKPVFRLKPPRKGFERKGIKKSYSSGGALGYRASDINELINRMA